jgi:hypothetical protein
VPSLRVGQASESVLQVLRWRPFSTGLGA